MQKNRGMVLSGPLSVFLTTLCGESQLIGQMLSPGEGIVKLKFNDAGWVCLQIGLLFLHDLCYNE